jgi:hypothetical protein
VQAAAVAQPAPLQLRQQQLQQLPLQLDLLLRLSSPAVHALLHLLLAVLQLAAVEVQELVWGPAACVKQPLPAMPAAAVPAQLLDTRTLLLLLKVVGHQLLLLLLAVKCAALQHAAAVPTALQHPVQTLQNERQHAAGRSAAVEIEPAVDRAAAGLMPCIHNACQLPPMTPG